MTLSYEVFAGANDMIAILGLPTKSLLTSLRLVCCGRFRQSLRRDFKATNAAAGFFGYFFFLKKKSNSRGRRQEKIISRLLFDLNAVQKINAIGN